MSQRTSVLQMNVLLGSYYTYWSYYTYSLDFWWIVLIIFITALLFLLFILFEKKVNRTVNFNYCTALPIIRIVLKKWPVTFISMYWSYNRNIRVLCGTLGSNLQGPTYMWDQEEKVKA